MRYPHERTHLQLAKLVDARRVGPFTLGHYQSNPPGRPDHITTSVCRFRSAAADDYECLSWRVTPATPEDLARWPARDSDGVSEHLVALSDASGDIVLFDFMDEGEAGRTLDAAARAGCPDLAGESRNPLSPESAECVTTYPLTREEVRLLAVHWEEKRVDNAAWCALTGTTGTTELMVASYGAERWRLAANILGEGEMHAVGLEADAHVRDKIGPEAWAAFKAGRRLWREEWENAGTEAGS